MKVLKFKGKQSRLLEIDIDKNAIRLQENLKKTAAMKQEFEQSRKKRGKNGTQRI